MSTTASVGGVDTPQPVDPWVVAHNSAEFATLRKRLHSFIFPVSVFFLAWYFLYVLLAAFAPGFMAIKVAGNINVGLVYGLLRFVSTVVITMCYARYAARNLDPISDRIRGQVEGGGW